MRLATPTPLCKIQERRSLAGALVPRAVESWEAAKQRQAREAEPSDSGRRGCSYHHLETHAGDRNAVPAGTASLDEARYCPHTLPRRTPLPHCALCAATATGRNLNKCLPLLLELAWTRDARPRPRWSSWSLGRNLLSRLPRVSAPRPFSVLGGGRCAGCRPSAARSVFYPRDGCFEARRRPRSRPHTDWTPGTSSGLDIPTARQAMHLPSHPLRPEPSETTVPGSAIR